LGRLEECAEPKRCSQQQHPQAGVLPSSMSWSLLLLLLLLLLLALVVLDST
jgi:hypothetical protein